MKKDWNFSEKSAVLKTVTHLTQVRNKSSIIKFLCNLLIIDEHKRAAECLDTSFKSICCFFLKTGGVLSKRVMVVTV